MMNEKEAYRQAKANLEAVRARKRELLPAFPANPTDADIEAHVDEEMRLEARLGYRQIEDRFIAAEKALVAALLDWADSACSPLDGGAFAAELREKLSSPLGIPFREKAAAIAMHAPLERRPAHVA